MQNLKFNWIDTQGPQVVLITGNKKASWSSSSRTKRLTGLVSGLVKRTQMKKKKKVFSLFVPLTGFCIPLRVHGYFCAIIGRGMLWLDCVQIQSYFFFVATNNTGN